jgi:hypothetical protein
MHFEFDITVKHEDKNYNVVGDTKIYRDYVNANPEGFDGQWDWFIDTMNYSVFDEQDNDVTDNPVSNKLEDHIVEKIYKMIDEEL